MLLHTAQTHKPKHIEDAINREEDKRKKRIEFNEGNLKRFAQECYTIYAVAVRSS